MRSGSTRVARAVEPRHALDHRCARCRRRRSCAPILLRQSATSTISGSRAAFSITVVAAARATAAISAVWVPPTVTLGNSISPPFSPPFGARDHIAAVDLDRRAEPLQRHDQQVDRPRADGAAARQRHLRLAHAGEQRRDHPEARAHLGDELVGRGGVDDARGRDVQGLAVDARSSPGRLPLHHHVDAVIAEDALQQRRRRRAAARCRGSASRR